MPLTSLRFLAAFMVFLVHARSRVPWLSEHNFLGRLTEMGYVGVPFFFELSGFVMALAYLRSLKGIDRKAFFVARFARIYPALFACLLISMPVYYLAEIHLFHHTPVQVAETLGLAFTGQEAWFPHLGVIDNPSWTITNEMFFYLSFPFVGPRLWKLNLKGLSVVAAALFLGENALVIISTHTTLPKLVIDRCPFMHFGEFLLGICVGKLAFLLAQDDTKLLWMRRYASLLAAGSLGLLLAIPLANLPIPAVLLQHMVLCPLFTAAILAFSSGNATISGMFSPAWFVLLGESSYAFYLLHAVLLDAAQHLLRPHPTLGISFVLLLTIGLSLVSFLYLETPGRLWIIRAAQQVTSSKPEKSRTNS